MNRDEVEKIASELPAMRPCGGGRWKPREGGDAPRVVVCRWVQGADGSFRPEPFPYRWAQITPELLRAMGFAPALDDRARRDTLRRLALAGFVRMVRISPGCTLLDMDSWEAHLSRCMADPDYWEKDGAAMKKYARANFTREAHD